MGAAFNDDGLDIEKPVLISGVAALLPPADVVNTRHDRVVALATNGSLKIVAPGKGEPLATIAPPADDKRFDRTAVPTWIGGSDWLLVRQRDRICLVDAAAGKVVWSVDAADTARGPRTAGVSTGAQALVSLDENGIVELAGDVQERVAREAALNGDNAVDPQFQRIQEQFLQAVANGQVDAVQAQQQLEQIRQNLQRQRVLAQRREMRVALDRQMPGEDWDPDPRLGEQDPFVPGGPDAEGRAGEGNADVNRPRFLHAAPAADGSMIIAATSRGDVIGIDVATGKVAWRNESADRPLSTFEVVDDVVVFSTTDELRSRLIALDAATGAPTLQQAFTGNGAQARIVNVAVSPEGWAVVVFANRLLTFDLLSGQQTPVAEKVVPTGGNFPPFRFSRSDGHVAVAGGRVMVLADLPMPNSNMVAESSVRQYDAGTLEPVTTQNRANGQRIETRLVPRYPAGGRTGNETLSMAAHGDRLYLSTGTSMTSYPLFAETAGNARAASWERLMVDDRPTPMSKQSPMLVKDGLVIVGWPVRFAGQPTPSAKLELYERESQSLAALTELGRSGSKVGDNFQPVNGGIYYATSDGTLVFVPGMKE